MDAPDSPAGPTGSGLFLGTRDRVQIRNVLLDAIVQGDGQLASGRRCFGGSRRAGSIDLDVSDDEIRAVIAGEEGELCRIRMGALRRCDATMLKFDALLGGGGDGGAGALGYARWHPAGGPWRGRSRATAESRWRAGRASGGSCARPST